MKKLHLSRNLMIAAILLIVAFQVYWLNKQYNDEYSSLKKEVDVTFRETIYKLQKQRFEGDRLLFQSSGEKDAIWYNEEGAEGAALKNNASPKQVKKPKSFSRIEVRGIGDMEALKHLDPSKLDSMKVFKSRGSMPLPPPGLIEIFVKQRLNGKDTSFTIKKDSSGKTIITNITYSTNARHAFFPSEKDSFNRQIPKKDTLIMMYGKSKIPFIKKGDSLKARFPIEEMSASPIIRFLSNSKSINDSIPVKTIDSAFKSELGKSSKKINYAIIFKKGNKNDTAKGDLSKDTSKEFATSHVLVGYNTPYSYQAKFNNVFSFIIQKMGWQISGSLLLLAFVVISFISLYRNLLAQRRLALIKNEFISNITHELKTPIATVSVAIEALKNFGGITSPERTKEYLDISSSELQRLSLLVDKVLKLSMFENREIELKAEALDMKKVVEEVVNTMKLQFEKHKAILELKTEGEHFTINADRLHMVSVLYNLLDNALKYSMENPLITVKLTSKQEHLEISVTDNGIGIAPEYKDRIFEKFFRVPMGNVHNTKGYGLGLSYVAHVVKKHQGFIEVKSKLGIGSSFTVNLPYNNHSNTIQFDNYRSISKEP